MTKGKMLRLPAAGSKGRKHIVESRGVAPSGDHKRPSFRFKHADPNKYSFHTGMQQELKRLLARLGDLERKTWREIKESAGDLGSSFRDSQAGSLRK